MKQTNYLKFAMCIAASAMLVGCAGTRYGRSTGQYIDDKATASRVKGALNDDSLVKGSEINVESFRGNVHLTGFVDHPVQKERASQLTRNVKGVDWFKNDIIVKENLPGETGMASGQQMNEPAGAARDSSQSSQQNYQQSQEQRSSGAPADSGWQKGALNVYDPAATIESQPAPTVKGQRSRPAAGERGASGLLQNEPAGSSDLAQRVSTQLQSDAAAQNIQVQSESAGKITLHGTVSSEAEKDAIESKAKSIPGVNDVDNQIEVQNK